MRVLVALVILCVLMLIMSIGMTQIARMFFAPEICSEYGIFIWCGIS